MVLLSRVKIKKQAVLFVVSTLTIVPPAEGVCCILTCFAVKDMRTATLSQGCFGYVVCTLIPCAAHQLHCVIVVLCGLPSFQAVHQCKARPSRRSHENTPNANRNRELDSGIEAAAHSRGLLQRPTCLAVECTVADVADRLGMWAAGTGLQTTCLMIRPECSLLSLRRPR